MDYRNYWLDAWNKNELKVTVETTSVCNAKCPQCARSQSFRYFNHDQEDILTNNVYDWIPKLHWDLEKFEKYFPPKTLQHFKIINFSGDLSDAGMNPHLPEIIEYIMDMTKKCQVHISTNGSMQSEDWWRNLGKICGDRLRVIFAVDGIDQEMHEKYRANTRLQKVLNNMKALSETDADVWSLTILFRHNQDYLEDIIALTKKHGATEHDWVESARFWRDKPFLYKDFKTGELKQLEEVIHNTKNTFGQQVDVETGRGEKPTFKKRTYDDGKDAFRRIKNDYTSLKKLAEGKQKTIRCAFGERDHMQLDVLGNLWPCCYWVCRKYVYEWGKGESWWDFKINKDFDKPVAKYVLEQPEKFNLDHYTFEEVLKSEWYNDTLVNSWKTGDFSIICAYSCGHSDSGPKTN